MSLEVWKDIEGFDGKYQISTWGRVRSVNGIMKPYENHKGYLKIGLFKDGKNHKKRISRLVAMAFIPNPDNKQQVDHIDGNRQNNSITNLRWASNKENQRNAQLLRKFKFFEEVYNSFDID